tara:strand:+ start:211 stop:414 length:204 start_codon:yes stop_codon:yes gene_type:complete
MRYLSEINMKKSITYFILITGLICSNLFSGIHSQIIFSIEDFESSGPDIPAIWTESGASTLIKYKQV